MKIFLITWRTPEGLRFESVVLAGADAEARTMVADQFKNAHVIESTEYVSGRHIITTAPAVP